MAKAAAEALAKRDVTYVVASPLERAQETAAPIAAEFGLEVATDTRLIESTNLFEGKNVSVGDGSFRNPRNWWVLRDPVTPSWGEAYIVIAQRMFAALQAAASPPRATRRSASRISSRSGPCAGTGEAPPLARPHGAASAAWPA